MENNDNGCFNSPLSCFFSLPPRQFALLSSLIGILLIDDLDVDQQNSLGNFIVGIGQAILVAAAQGQVLESNSADDNKSNDHMQQQIQLLKKQICLLEQQLNNQCQ